MGEARRDGHHQHPSVPVAAQGAVGDALGDGMRLTPAPPPDQPAPISTPFSAPGNPVAAPEEVSYNRSTVTGSSRSGRWFAARRAPVPGQRPPPHMQPPTGDPGVSTTATHERGQMEAHPAVLEPDDDLVPPDDGDLAPDDAPDDDAPQRT